MEKPNNPVQLPDYLEDSMESLESAFALKADLREVFTTFFLDEIYTGIISPSRKWEFFELYNSLTTLLENCIMERLGPMPNMPTLPLPKNEDAPLRADMLPLFTANPHLCDDMGKLREWVQTLQESGRIQDKRIACQEKMLFSEARMRLVLHEQVTRLEQLNGLLTKLQTDTAKRLN